MRCLKIQQHDSNNVLVLLSQYYGFRCSLDLKARDVQAAGSDALTCFSRALLQAQSAQPFVQDSSDVSVDSFSEELLEDFKIGAVLPLPIE